MPPNSFVAKLAIDMIRRRPGEDPPPGGFFRAPDGPLAAARPTTEQLLRASANRTAALAKRAALERSSAGASGTGRPPPYSHGIAGTARLSQSERATSMMSGARPPSTRPSLSGPDCAGVSPQRAYSPHDGPPAATPSRGQATGGQRRAGSGPLSPQLAAEYRREEGMMGLTIALATTQEGGHDPRVVFALAHGDTPPRPREVPRAPPPPLHLDPPPASGRGAARPTSREPALSQCASADTSVRPGAGVAEAGRGIAEGPGGEAPHPMAEWRMNVLAQYCESVSAEARHLQRHTSRSTLNHPRSGVGASPFPSGEAFASPHGVMSGVPTSIKCAPGGRKRARPDPGDTVDEGPQALLDAAAGRTPARPVPGVGLSAPPQKSTLCGWCRESKAGMGHKDRWLAVCKPALKVCAYGLKGANREKAIEAYKEELGKEGRLGEDGWTVLPPLEGSAAAVGGG